MNYKHSYSTKQSLYPPPVATPVYSYPTTSNTLRRHCLLGGVGDGERGHDCQLSTNDHLLLITQ